MYFLDYLSGVKKMPSGDLIKVNGGNFYVKDNNKIIVCHASGKLRDYKVIPVPGDRVIYEELENDILLLKEFSKETGCLAMAAVQLGIPKRLIYVRNTNLEDLENRSLDEGVVLINPKMIKVILSKLKKEKIL